jgi:hypothetical protein
VKILDTAETSVQTLYDALVIRQQGGHVVVLDRNLCAELEPLLSQLLCHRTRAPLQIYPRATPEHP